MNTDDTIRLRQETKSLPMFNYLIVNWKGQIEAVISQGGAIITNEKCLVNQRVIEL